MINVSEEFERFLNSDRRNYQYFIDVTLTNGKVLNITNANLWSGTFKIEDSVSKDNNFDVGDAIINKLSFSLNNIYGDYSSYDFKDAKVIAYVGLQLSSSLEKLRKFTGKVDEATYNGSLIEISSLDNMSNADADFDADENKIKFPATILTIIQYCATRMGVSLDTPDFPNKSFVIESLPQNSSQTLTYRQMISYCAQICGCFARCNRFGNLELSWYNQEGLIQSFKDGGTFDTTTTPYSDGDEVDGGTFDTTTTPYSDGDSVDDGFIGSADIIHYFSGYSSHNLGVDDVVITGVQVKSKEQNSEPILSGKKGYVISIENNPLITEDNKQTIADYLGKRLIGFKFRTLTASVLSDPSIEAGDVGFFYGLDKNYYPVVVSSVTFAAGNYTQIKSSAETPSRNKATTYSQETKNYVELRERIAKEKAEREIQAQKLDDAINTSPGLYTTIENASSGKIFYFHDKKNLSESTFVWKMTAQAWGVSTDGGKTFNGGMTVDGDTITRILTATGINAGWINTGKLVIKDSDNNITFLADTATGEVYVKADTVQTKVGGKYRTLEDVANELEGTIQTEKSNIQTSFQTSIEQTQNSLNLSIQQNAKDIKQTADDLSSYKDTQETYFHFGKDGLEIGKTVNGYTPFSTLLSDQKLAFRQNGMDVAYIQYNKLHINEIEAVNKWSVGASENGGFFDFISTKYGMGIKWRDS